MSDSMVRYQIRLPKELDDWLEERSEESCRSKSSEIVYLLKCEKARSNKGVQGNE